MLVLASPALALADWSPVREIHGILVEAQPTQSGFDAHRAEILLCTEIADLAAFISDTSRFHEWIPRLQHVKLLDASEYSVTYHMRNRSPWPFKPRDMIYQLTRTDDIDKRGSMVIELKGLPDYLPPQPDAHRMSEARGQWRIVRQPDGLRVTHELYVNPGNVPKFFANRSLAASLARTLANLARQFAC